jgi:pimeloyl-ACP methyl ester carboxylesterase
LRAFATRLGRRVFLKAVCTTPPAGNRALEVFGAFATSKAARRDALRVTQSLTPSVTLDAVPALQAYSKPVLLAWGDQDKLFPLDHARRLQADLPNARVEIIEGSSTFVMLDQPAKLAAAIERFIRR